jgi:hypothetical protein
MGTYGGTIAAVVTFDDVLGTVILQFVDKLGIYPYSHSDLLI